MTIPSVTPSQIRCALKLRDEIALLDVRHEASFATGHPLFAANMAAERIALEAVHADSAFETGRTNTTRVVQVALRKRDEAAIGADLSDLDADPEQEE